MTKIIWENKETFGYEYFSLNKEQDIIAKGTIIATEQKKPMLIRYTIILNSDWVTKEVFLKMDSDKEIKIFSDGNGEWFQGDNKINHLTGAIDVDISATPFSNSIPINREDWNIGDEKCFQMVYISIPELEMKKIEQKYTYTENLDGVYYFKYECKGYQTEIQVDEGGLVIDYPNVFKRMYL